MYVVREDQGTTERRVFRSTTHRPQNNICSLYSAVAGGPLDSRLRAYAIPRRSRSSGLIVPLPFPRSSHKTLLGFSRPSVTGERGWGQDYPTKRSAPVKTPEDIGIIISSSTGSIFLQDFYTPFPPPWRRFAQDVLGEGDNVFVRGKILTRIREFTRTILSTKISG